jgi:hypothetical protein
LAGSVPFDVAFSLDDVTRAAFSIILSEQRSAVQFNWVTMKFDENQP